MAAFASLHAFPRSLPFEQLERRPVAFYRCDASGGPAGHDLRARAAVAEMLAELLDREFAGVFERDDPPAPRHYLVPSATLCSLDEARRLGVRGAEDLFGGVVPHPFVATKVITHPLVDEQAAAPAGWSHALGRQLENAALPGYSVFSAADARRAAERLFAHGAVRLKSAEGVGGSGQTVARDRDEFEARLAAIDPVALARHGWVIETDLEGVSTFSVGQVMAGRWTVAYCGTQHETLNHNGHSVYGGSEIRLVRGGFEALLQQELTLEATVAVQQAMAYHEATHRAFDTLFASRVNYDVAQGHDGQGRRRSGVLEQSWRIGGASGAEVAGLLAFKQEPTLASVIASTHEVYHDDAIMLPAGCRVLYDDVDPVVGRLTKYVQVSSHVHA